MTEIILARHGQTIWHAENRYAGRSDIALTPRGEEQARDLATWAAGAGLSDVVSSTLGRARATAAKCGNALDLIPSADERLVELDFGQGEGMTTAEMRDAFPDALSAFHAAPATARLPGGEAPVDAAERFIDALTDLVRADPDGRVLVVAHTTVIRLALCALIGLPLDEYRRVFPRLDNCALTRIDLDPDTRRAALLALNIPPTLAR